MRIVNKSLTEAEEFYICHGVNCKGKFNAGVAKAIREKWPAVYHAYVDNYDRFKLGETQLVDIGDKTVINLFSQVTYGRTGVHASEEAITIGLYDFITNYKPETIAISQIGCNLGGLKWEDVSQILEMLEDEFGVEFVVYYI